MKTIRVVVAVIRDGNRVFSTAGRQGIAGSYPAKADREAVKESKENKSTGRI